MSVARYSRWDGTQNPLADLSVADQLADAFADRLLDGMSARQAMRDLMQNGMPGQFGGLQNLRNRLRELREQREQQSHLGAVLEELRDELAAIVDTERAELVAADDSDARFQEAMLANLPPDPAGQIRELNNYPFRSQEAQRRFGEMMERLRKEMLDAYLGQVAEGMQQMSPEDLAELKDMLADLNRMVEQHRAGLGPSQDEFAEFMNRHGKFFPENPQTFEELMEAMAKRAEAMSRLMASMSPEQRAEMARLAEELMGDMDLAFEVSRLGANLRDVFPEMGWGQPVNMEGQQPVGMGAALSEIERISEFERLEACMLQDYPGASLDDVDTDAVSRLLGEDAGRDLEALKEIEKALSDAGMVETSGGKIELTPRGIRKLGERALATVFERLELDREGSHEIHQAGGFGEPTGQTRAWRFGDPFRIDLQGTVHNAVLREGPSDGRINLAPDDFMLAEAETRTSTATVLLLDMSRSMPLRGHWAHARAMAFALHSLITSRYPEDRLHIVGFSDYARVIRPKDLTSVSWEPVYGTNYEHAFLLAGRLLAKDPSASKQILLVTDGEPTAHLVGDEVFFQWPPVPETIRRTMKEAVRLSRSGATMNIFMLEDDPGLAGFIDRLARQVQGRVFAVADRDLGANVVRDYVRSKGR